MAFHKTGTSPIISVVDKDKEVKVSAAPNTSTVSEGKSVSEDKKEEKK